MGVPRKNFISLAILEILNPDLPLYPLENTYEWLQRKKRVNRIQYRKSLRGMRSRGILKIVKKNNQEFIKLTQKGQLQLLLTKPTKKILKDWDGKWRVLIFDIPEASHSTRDSFRKMLKQNGFKQLQASVFISPHELSRPAINYLKTSGLIKFIRIMRVEEMDNDKDLRKKFNLS